MTSIGAIGEIRVVDVAGGHRDIGRQHGQAVRGLRQQIEAAAERHLAELPSDSAGMHHVELKKLREVLERHSPATLEQIEGLAEGLDLEPDLLFRAATASYLHDLIRGAQNVANLEGCTVWAASGWTTVGGVPLLVKNRDYRVDHLPLQIVLRVRSRDGIPWCAVTSAGAPGVYSSGMNAAGLAVADTHVPSRDLGPGLPRYSLMLNLLEGCETVAAALAYLASVPQMGGGNLVLADARGEIAVVECGHRARGTLRRQAGSVVATNHFVTPELAGAYLEIWPGGYANSCGRYAAVEASLRHAAGRVDPAFARSLMARHDGPLRSLCRHGIERYSETISCAIYSPASRKLDICHGRPCTARYRTVAVIES